MCLPPSGHLTLNHHTHCTEETEAQGISHVPRPAPREAQGWDLNTDTCLAPKFMFNHTGAASPSFLLPETGASPEGDI